MEHFVVRHYTDDPHPTIKGNGFDGLVIGNFRDEAENFIKWVNAVIDRAAQAKEQNGHNAQHGNGAEPPEICAECNGSKSAWMEQMRVYKFNLCPYCGRKLRHY